MWRVLCVFLVVVSLSACGVSHKKPPIPPELLVAGPIESDALMSNYQAFADAYANWQPTAEEVAAMQGLEGKDVRVILGLWCSDSQREVPRFVKLLERSGVTLSSLEMVTVDRQKTDPGGVAKRYQVEYVPTIVILEGEKELGRFVESPKGDSMAQDLADIVSGTKG